MTTTRPRGRYLLGAAAMAAAAVALAPQVAQPRLVWPEGDPSYW